MSEISGLLNIQKSRLYCEERYGIAPGRDWLYAQARARAVPVVWIGKRRLYFPCSSLDALMAGQGTR